MNKLKMKMNFLIKQQGENKMSKKKLFRISMHCAELYEVEAEDEDEALDIISLGEEEPIEKEYYGDDEIWEVKE